MKINKTMNKAFKIFSKVLDYAALGIILYTVLDMLFLDSEFDKEYLFATLLLAIQYYHGSIIDKIEETKNVSITIDDEVLREPIKRYVDENK